MFVFNSLFIESQTFTKNSLAPNKYQVKSTSGYENFLADFFEYFLFDNIIFIFYFLALYYLVKNLLIKIFF